MYNYVVLVCYALVESNAILKEDKDVQFVGFKKVWYDLWDYLKVHGKLEATESSRGQT